MPRLAARMSAPTSDRPYALIERDGAAALADLDADAIIDLFKAHGALLLRGFGADLEHFHRFAARFCSSSVFNESPDRQLLDAANNIQSVNGGSDAFPLHPELSREPWKPDACFFHCLKPPATGGGETVICDGIELVRQLPAEVRRGLGAHRLLYIMPAPPWQLAYWFGTETPSVDALRNPPAGCPYRFLSIDGVLARSFTRPALHKPLFAEGPAFGNFLLFARYHVGRRDFPLLDTGQPVPDAWVEAVKATGDGLSVPIAWAEGDLLMLDNSRFMHGRNPIADPAERLIASHFGYLRFAPVDPEEPADPIWRRSAFRPPQPYAVPR
jgi:hypothetical protein